MCEERLCATPVKSGTRCPSDRELRFHSRDSLGFEKLDLPPQELETVAMWFAPPEAVARHLAHEGMVVGEALIGIANVVTEVAPLFVMCDTQDISTVVNSSCLGKDALFLYDRYPGGMGYASRCLGAVEQIMETARAVIRECRCEDGCPSCVGSAVPAFAQTDMDSTVRGRIPDKTAALLLDLVFDGA